MTPSHVKTSLCTLCTLTFLLKLARAQHTLNSDKIAETVFKSLKVFCWYWWTIVDCCTRCVDSWPPSVLIFTLLRLSLLDWSVIRMYDWINSIGAASQKPWISLNMHKSRTSCFTNLKSTGMNNFEYLQITPSCATCAPITEYLPIFDVDSTRLADGGSECFVIFRRWKYHRSDTI